MRPSPPRRSAAILVAAARAYLIAWWCTLVAATLAYLIAWWCTPAHGQQREALRRHGLETTTRAQQPDNGHRWCPDPALPVVVDMGDPPCPPREQCAIAHCTRYPDLVPGAAPRAPCRAWMMGAGRQLRQHAVPTVVGCMAEVPVGPPPPEGLIFADGFESGNTGRWR